MNHIHRLDLRQGQSKTIMPPNGEQFVAGCVINHEPNSPLWFSFERQGKQIVPGPSHYSCRMCGGLPSMFRCHDIASPVFGIVAGRDKVRAEVLLVSKKIEMAK